MTVQHAIIILEFLYHAVIAYAQTPAGQAELLAIEETFAQQPAPTPTPTQQATRNVQTAFGTEQVVASRS